MGTRGKRRARKSSLSIAFPATDGRKRTVVFRQIPGVTFQEHEHVGPPPAELGEDWLAWRDAFQAHRPWNFYPLSANAPSPSDAAIEALRRSVHSASIAQLIDATYARLAIALTLRFQALRIMGTSLGPGFGDVVVSALNRHPDVASTAAMILVPALRNL